MSLNYLPIPSSSASGGAVGGASNLTTAGAVPYVVSAGVLGQAPTGLFYDASNVTLQIGTSLTKVFLGNIVSGSTYPGVWLGNITPSITNYSLLLDAGFSTILNTQSASHSLDFRQASNIKARLAATTGNFLIGPSGTDGNYKLDIQASGSSGTMRVFDQGGAGSTLAVVQAGASQSGNLQEWRNNAGTVTSAVDNVGQVFSASFITNSGTSALVTAQNTLKIYNAGQIVWSSTSGYSGSADLGLARNSAGVFEINSGTAGTYRDLKLRYLNSSANSTGAGSALLGANSPAVTLTAPYTWVEMRANDNSVVYFPVWK